MDNKRTMRAWHLMVIVTFPLFIVAVLLVWFIHDYPFSEVFEACWNAPRYL